MAFTYYNESWLCRSIRSTKLYISPTDIIPTISKVLPAGVMFVSDRYMQSGLMKLYQITSAVNGDVPIGYWCPSDVLEMTPIEQSEEVAKDTTFDDSISTTECLVVKSEKVAVYNNKDDKTPIESGLKVGNRIFTDLKISINNNGTMETRYRIINTTNSDVDLSGKWITENYAANSKMKAEDYSAGISLMSYIDPTEILGTTTSPEDSPVFAQVTQDSPVKSTEELLPGYSTLQDLNADEYSKEDADLEAARKMDTSSKEFYDTYGLNYEYAGESLGQVPIGRMTFVHGMPFQYNYITDRRNGATSPYGEDSSDRSDPERSGSVDMYGRTFAREIAGNMPIMVLVPGVPVYLTKTRSSLLGYSGGSSNMRNLWTPFWNDLTDTEYQSAFEELINNTSGGTYDYYSMEVDLTGYFKYVNALCRTSATFMGLSKTKFRGKACDKFDWGTYNQNVSHDYTMFEEVIGLSGGVSFAYDPLSSISDSITNTTTESSFAGFLNQMTSKTKELQFLVGQSGADFGAITDFNSYEASLQSALTSSGALSNVEQIVKRITSLGSNAAKGFNIRFPEIWSDSSHSRSYSVDMHFITPYNTAFCKWRYVLVPFFHLFALAAPQAPDNMSIYGRPYLIKAYSMGYFNVELGIIESLEWRRYGDGDMISSDGIPTQIDVSVNFKDLYHVLTMGKTDSVSTISAFFSNTGLMNVIGELSGVNMNTITIGERISLYVSAASNALTGMPTNFMRHISDRIRNLAENYIVGL